MHMDLLIDLERLLLIDYTCASFMSSGFIGPCFVKCCVSGVWSVCMQYSACACSSAFVMLFGFVRCM